jgi:hypothetical protein
MEHFNIEAIDIQKCPKILIAGYADDPCGVSDIVATILQISDLSDDSIAICQNARHVCHREYTGCCRRSFMENVSLAETIDFIHSRQLVVFDYFFPRGISLWSLRTIPSLIIVTYTLLPIMYDIDYDFVFIGRSFLKGNKERLQPLIGPVENTDHQFLVIHNGKQFYLNTKPKNTPLYICP